jgi:hypothetical protein
MKKYMTIVHAKNQLFILSFAELLFLKTAVEMWVLNCSINCQKQPRDWKRYRNLKDN